MEKKSELFKNISIKGNNRTFTYGSNNVPSKTEVKPSRGNINRKISNIFKSTNYVYKMEVEITLNSGVIKKQIIARTNDYLITLDNEKIFIKDIIDIVEIKE